MYPIRLNNLYLFLGRGGVAVIVLSLAISCFASLSWVGAAFGAALLLFDIAIWFWATGNPLWLDVGPEGIRARWVFSTSEHLWKGVKVFWMRETLRTRDVYTRHLFAHFRTGEGKWFKVRVNGEQIEEFSDLVPEGSQGKGMIGHIELNG